MIYEDVLTKEVEWNRMDNIIVQSRIFLAT